MAIPSGFARSELACNLREHDMSPVAARALLGPDTLIGKSVHTAAGAALAAGADYILAGHVYPSASKPGRSPLGVAGFAAIVAAAPCPVLAIGGVTPERVQEVVQAGAHGVAVIGAIAEADDPRAAASALRTALEDAIQAHGKEPADERHAQSGQPRQQRSRSSSTARRPRSPPGRRSTISWPASA